MEKNKMNYQETLRYLTKINGIKGAIVSKPTTYVTFHGEKEIPVRLTQPQIERLARRMVEGKKFLEEFLYNVYGI